MNTQSLFITVLSGATLFIRSINMKSNYIKPLYRDFESCCN